jgi:DNA-binding winged helix-turn-helix (wHTH) protein
LPSGGASPFGEDALVWDVTTLRWPSQGPERVALAAARRPCLLLVAAGEPPPPSWGDLEDWTREGADPVELFVRCERLRRRSAERTPVTIDDDGLVWRSGRWAALTPSELRGIAPLLARAGQGVSRADLLASIAPGRVVDDHRTVDRIVRRLRRRLAPLGLSIHAVRGTGFLLQTGPLPD